jgi:hypothetical protein
MPDSIAVIGSGSLAREVCRSIATATDRPVVVHVIARSAAPLAEIAFSASTHAALAGAPAWFRTAVVDLASPAKLAAALDRAAPSVVLCCASDQSPWEARQSPSAWTELVRRAGFGITLPMQARVAVPLAAALPAGARLVNACFPDAVNPLLKALGLPVFCGVGNAALVAAVLQSALGLANQHKLRVLAHHLHLHEPAEEGDEALAWLGDDPVPDVGKLLHDMRASARPQLNAITGQTAAGLLRDLLAGVQVPANLPGPLGEPGGYPVTIVGDQVIWRLPTGWDLSRAVGWNQRMSELDGCRVDPWGDIVFADRAVCEIRRWRSDFPQRWPTSILSGLIEVLGGLRSQLRGMPWHAITAEGCQRGR